MAFIDSLAQAIAIEEGFYVSGSRAQRNNNPGNLWGGSGAFTLDSGQFRVYPTPDAGWAALYADLNYKTSHHPEWSLLDLFNVWLGGKPGVTAPASQGNSMKYATDVANFLSVNLGPGFSIGTTLADGNNGAVLASTFDPGATIPAPGDTGTSPQVDIASPDGTVYAGDGLVAPDATDSSALLWVAGAGVAAYLFSEIF